MTATQVQQQIAENYTDIEQDVHAVVPGYQVTAMALPFGVFPVDHVLAHQGSYNGTSYNLYALMLVGANPASWYSKTVDPLKPPADPVRPRWRDRRHLLLDREVQAHPSMLFISDGNPTKISLPS